MTCQLKHGQTYYLIIITRADKLEATPLSIRPIVDTRCAALYDYIRTYLMCVCVSTRVTN